MRLVASSLTILAVAGSGLAASAASAAPMAPTPGPSVFGPAPASPQPETAPQLSSPTVLVKAASEEAAQAIAARHDLTLSRAFAWIGWYELATKPGTTDASAAKAALDADGAVEATDALAKDEDLSLTYTPKDPVFSGGATFNGQPVGWSYTNANFPSAWDRTTGAGANIGIIDSEFDTSHPDLQSKVRNPYNTASGTAKYHTGDVRAADTDNVNVLHGTHVAGTAAASTDNGLGTSGGGFDATFTPVRIKTSFQPGGGNPVDAAFVGDLTEALGYIASQPVGVVSMSLGTTRNHAPMQAAINAVRARGITVIASAGNFQQSEPNAAIYPASYPGVIAVGNTQANDTINPSSSNGNWVDVAAPGTDIYSTWDMRDDKPGFRHNGDQGNYNIITGTSMAAPLVAGLVGLMKAVRPDLTPDEVEAILKGTTRDLGSPGPDPQFGAGAINASAAVNAAAAYVRPVPPAPPAPPAPAPAPPAPPADTVAPKVSIKGLVTLAGRSVTVRFGCAEACSGKVRLRTTKRKLLVSKSFKAAAGKSVTVRLKTKKRLKNRSTVIVEIAARDAAGNLATKAERRKLRK
jgi:subtilisin family serine protease